MLILLGSVVRLIRPISLLGLAPIAMAAFIGVEAVIFNFLSVFNSLTGTTVIVSHLVILLSMIGVLYKCGSLGRRSNYLQLYNLVKRLKRPGAYIFFPLLILIGCIVWMYPPNTYDTLTYHMARVAHWIQSQNIGYFPTPIDRQNMMGPGAEYLILFFQIICGSDYLACIVQYLSFIVLIPSCFYLCRLLRVPRKLIPFVVLLSTTIPIAVFQASTAKNDIVAALLGYAILISARRFYLGGKAKATTVDYGLVSLSVAAAFLVKPTAILVTIPIVAVGCLCKIIVVRNLSIFGQSVVRGIVLALIVFTAIAGPDLGRKVGNDVERNEVYPLMAEFNVDRFWNPLRIMAHNIPFTEESERLYYMIGGTGQFRTNNVFANQEDIVGNPYQMVAILVLSFWALFHFIVSLLRGNLVLAVLPLLPLLSWISFGLMVRDQVWITRLQIPLFYLLPFSFTSLSLFFNRFKVFASCVLAVTATYSFVSLAYALLIACNVSPRPLLLSYFWGERPGWVKAYYNNVQELFNRHSFFLEELKKHQCDTAGLLLGPDSVDYPLTWRAMQSGVSVRHLWYMENSKKIKMEEAIHDVCGIYVAYGNREHAPRQKEQWFSAGDYHTFLRNYKYDFDKSQAVCKIVDVSNYKEYMLPLQAAKLEQENNSIRLISTGKDPQIGLLNIEGCLKNDAVVQVVLASSQKSHLQLFYKTELDQSYQAKNSITERIAEGENIVYLHLAEEDNLTSVRLDIGDGVGEYELKRVEIRNIYYE